jgi:hypothetical protein
VNLQLFHLVGTSVWLGGLVALALVRRQLTDALPATVRRYSILAGWCLGLVTLSGIGGAWLRLPSAASVLSSYGAILGLKLAAVTMPAAAGWWHRRRAVAALARGSDRAFWGLVAVELAVLASAAGLGVALARTAPQVGQDAPQPLTAAESLLGRPLPAPLDASQWFTAWSIDTLFLPLVVAAVVWYLLAARRLWRRGDAWSW